MRNHVRATILAVAVIAISFSTVMPTRGADTKPAGQTDVPVRVVVLFSSGVGYFEHAGMVKGDATTELRFKTQQINDILKSLVLQDSQGKIGNITYPSQDPISKTLKSFQIDITNNPSLADLLNQLRGAKVKVVAGTETLSGTILGLEKKPKAVEKGQIEIWSLNLISGAIIRSIALDDVTKIELEDPVLQEELSKALKALAEARDQDKKPVTIHFQGDKERMVRLGYVVETPVWKTSYRLILNKEQSSLQGWAIVENQTDNDWNEVQLSLVSGRPISFIQELYQPLYIPRPIVQPELFASLRPQTYEAGMELRKEALAEKATEEQEALGRTRRLARAPAAPAASAAGGAFFRKDLAAINEPMDAASSVASVASAGKIGELFQYSVSNVSLPRQRSAMLPIVTDPIDVEKLSIYNLNVLPKNPLNGAKVKNTTKKHLLAGPVTVLDGGAYAGDARIDNVPPGQERLLSYGVDLQVLVNATKNRQDSSITGGKIVKGVLQLKRKNMFTQEYVAENKDDKDRTLIIEHPFRPGWKLTAPEKASETTDALYRFRTTVPAGKQSNLTVKEEIVAAETVQILPMDIGTLEFYGKNGEISKDVRDALMTAAKLKREMEEAQRQVNQRKSEIQQITNEQVRIRENIKTAPDKSTLKNRLLEKLDEQEKRIDAIYQQMDDQQKSYDAKRKELEDFVAKMNIGE